jgi:predicted nucleic acid-binding protein
MARFIDTSVLMTIERRGLTAAHVRGLIPGEGLAIASITASELLVGVHLADTAERRERRRAFVETVLQMLPVIPFDLRVARTHGVVAARLQSTRQSVGTNDMLVAATALAYECPVVTDNVKEFERVQGLTVVAPGW